MPFYPRTKGSGFADNHTDEEHRRLHARELFETHHDAGIVHQELDQAHGPEHAHAVMRRFDAQSTRHKRAAIRYNNARIAVKDTLDRIGFSFVNLQFLNIIFYILVPSYLIIGLALSCRSFVSAWVENNYEALRGSFQAEKVRGYWYGSLLGYALIFTAFTITFNLIVPYAILFILIGVLGALYVKSGLVILSSGLPRDKMSHYVKWIAYYGLFITAGILVLAGVLLDIFDIPLAIGPLVVYGYAMLFFIAGLLFLISAYVLSALKQASTHEERHARFREIIAKNREDLRAMLAKRGPIRSLLIAGMLFYGIQTTLNYYLGLHLFEEYLSFTFVAILLAATIITAFAVPLFFDKRSVHRWGNAPMLLLGSGLAFLLPALFALSSYPPTLRVLNGLLGGGYVTSTISAAEFFPLFYIFIGVAGSSIAGIAFSRIALAELPRRERGRFMNVLGMGTGALTAGLILLVFSLRYVSGSPALAFASIALIYLVVTLAFGIVVEKLAKRSLRTEVFARTEGNI